MRTFPVYEGLLKHYSSYFRAALKKVWIEGQSKSVTLPTEDPEVFRAFFRWISTGKLYSRLAPDGKIPLTFETICEIYVFGDARGAPELCNATINMLFQKCMQDWVYPSSTLDYIYDNTPDKSVLRNFVVDYAVETFSFSDIRLNEPEYPKSFLVSVIKRLVEVDERLCYMNRGPPGNYIHWKKTQICSKYHDHSAAEPASLP